MSKIILLDSNSLVYRAYYALQQSALKNSQGTPTGAIFGFISMLARLIKEEKPTHIVAAFDMRAPTFRHKMYDGYKSTRKPMPEDLVVQMPMLKKMLKSMGIKILELETYEADDILGTIAKRFDIPTIIVTGDRDSLQLVDDSTKIFFTRRGITDIVRYDEARLLEDGFTPKMVIDYKGLRGDASDNIPGIAGVGEKTAKILLNEYKTLENVLDNADKLKGKLSEKIANGRDIAILSKELATININVPIECSLDDIEFKYPLSSTVKNAFAELEFFTLINRFEFDESDETDKMEEAFSLPEINTVNINSIEELKDAIKKCAGKPIALMINEYISFAVTENEQYVVNPTNDLFGGLLYEDIIHEIKPLLIADTDKIFYDYKALLHLLSEQNISIGGQIFDQQILAHLVKGSKHFPSMSKALGAFGFGEEENVASLIALNKKLLVQCDTKNLNHLYYDIELPLIKVLYDMESTGIAIDEKILSDLSKKYTAELELLTKNIYEMAGETFNINSPKQLSNILFEKLALPIRKKNKIKKSSSIEVLNDLYDAHPIIPFIIRYRQLAKLQSTYIEGLIKVIASDNRIHSLFNQTVTATGRLSSTEPNLQNIPTRTAEGREIRRAFVAKDGNILICADYSQIELRLLAHFSQDENLIRAYNECQDIHASTAAEIFGVLPSEVTSNMRRDAKAVNFGIIYGISGFGLAINLSISAWQAKEYIAKYFETYPRVKEYMNENVLKANKDGFITSYAGRIRDLPEINSPNHNVREFGKRAAMNMPLQGTAADIIKIAMINVAKMLKGTSAKMLLQVHDELIIEAKKEDKDKITGILTQCMENAVKLRVPLTVNIKSGKNWFEAE